VRHRILRTYSGPHEHNASRPSEDGLSQVNNHNPIACTRRDTPNETEEHLTLARILLTVSPLEKKHFSSKNDQIRIIKKA
jgi:hypothetical protein